MERSGGLKEATDVWVIRLWNFKTVYCVYYSRYIYVCMLSYLFAFTGQSFDPRLHWQVSNLFSAARILCVLISSAVVTTTNSTTTFICSEDAPRKNVHCILKCSKVLDSNNSDVRGFIWSSCALHNFLRCHVFRTISPLNHHEFGKW